MADRRIVNNINGRDIIFETKESNQYRQSMIIDSTGEVELSTPEAKLTIGDGTGTTPQVVLDAALSFPNTPALVFAGSGATIGEIGFQIDTAIRKMIFNIGGQGVIQGYRNVNTGLLRAGIGIPNNETPLQLFEIRTETTSPILMIHRPSGGSGEPSLQLKNQSNTWSTSHVDFNNELRFIYNGLTRMRLSTTSGADWILGSDRRLKSNIEDATAGLDVISQIKTREFTWKADGARDIGFIAQELKETYPLAVSGNEEDFYIDEDGYEQNTMGVSPTKLIPVLVKAVQELSAKNDELENYKQQSQDQITALAARLDALENN